MTNGTARPPHRDAQLAQHLNALLGDAAPAALSFLQQHLQWVELDAGAVFMQQGAPGDSVRAPRVGWNSTKYLTPGRCCATGCGRATSGATACPR
ncbi:MAG: hypothetical protein M3Q28_10010 [Pseudomonadota bacterium]|nr:hypothetical protein [Pseudomonadota bacterium]